MNAAFDNMMQILSVLGAYFSVILVLSLLVEIILESIKENEFLNRTIKSHLWLDFLDVRRQHISPDQAMRDVAYWLPPKSQAEAKVAVLANLAKEFDVKLDEFTDSIEASNWSRDFIALTGTTKQAAQTQGRLAQKLFLVRQQYDLEESKRIMRLRQISAVIGIIIALWFGLDTFAFIGGSFNSSTQLLFANPIMATFGKILTGVAASTGSAFWHDQLDRIRAVKESTRTMKVLSQPQQ